MKFIINNQTQNVIMIKLVSFNRITSFKTYELTLEEKTDKKKHSKEQNILLKRRRTIKKNNSTRDDWIKSKINKLKRREILKKANEKHLSDTSSSPTCGIVYK